MQHTILIVDDEKDMVALLRDNFSMLGYLVLTATGYDEAVEKAARGPDIILLDVNMPGRDGLDVCSARTGGWRGRHPARRGPAC